VYAHAGHILSITVAPVMTSPLVRVVFGALVLATVAAFFVTQQLKGEVPVVLRFGTAPDSISPNGDGVRDSTRIGFDLSRTATVTFDVIDDNGRRVRRLVDDRRLAGDEKHRFTWDGKDENGAVVPDGVYRMRVIRQNEGRILDSIKTIRVDTEPPKVEIVSARPNVISPGDPGYSQRVLIRYRGPRNVAPEIRVFRTDEGPTRVVYRFRGNRSRSAVWDGTVRGEPAADGNYTFTVRLRDRAGNEAVGPRPIPTAAVAGAGTGVAVRDLTLQGPVGTVSAGTLAGLRVGPGARARDFEFGLSGVGSGTVLRRGRRVGTRFRVRVPARARTGVYLVRVRSGRGRAVWPLAVTGLPLRHGAVDRPRPLVMLPVASWQGLTAFDDDLDGFGDTLDTAPDVPLGRPYQGDRLPPAFSQTASLLRFLDRERLPYELTTDVALDRRGAPALQNTPAVVLAGTERWLPAALGERLRAYVRRGGRLASFGAALRRRVTLTDSMLRDPTPPGDADLFGERTELVRTGRAPLVVDRDDLGLFRGLDRFMGAFTRFERSMRLPGGARMLSSAGRASGPPAFVAYRLGNGVVVRVGTPQWSSELAGSAANVEVAHVTKRLWSFLGQSR
jgi:FlgD Ig-like domain